MDVELIDRIYEAGFLPELWPSVLGSMADFTQARGGYIISANPQATHWTASEKLEEALKEVVCGGWLNRGDRLRRLLAMRRPGFITDQDIYAGEHEKALDPWYKDLMWPVGLGRSAGNHLQLPTGDVLVFAFERAQKRGPFDVGVVARLDLLYPHLVRSVLLAARLTFERARAASEMLALVGLPAFVFTVSGAILAANRLVQELSGHVIWRARDRVALKDKVANRQLQRAMQTVSQNEAGLPRSFPIRDELGSAALVAHVIPVRRFSRDILVACDGVVVLTPVAEPKTPKVELLMSLFDLTPSQARVARSLTAGASLDDVATNFGVSRNTVRTHLRGALEKTGCSRQGELIALLAGIALF